MFFSLYKYRWNVLITSGKLVMIYPLARALHNHETYVHEENVINYVYNKIIMMY